MIDYLMGAELTEFDGDPVVTRESAVSLERDKDGRIERSTRTGLLASDEQSIEVTWAASAEDDFWAPSETTRIAWDWNTDQLEEIERTRTDYDGLGIGNGLTQGVITGTEADGGSVSAGLTGDLLSWTFTRDGLGRITETSSNFAGGLHSYIDGFDYGGTQATATRNALGHTGSTQYDAAGRTEITTDANGVQTRIEYDGLGRQVASHLTPVGGIERELERRTYYMDEIPNHVAIASTRYETDTDPGQQTTSYQVLDGMGEVVQAWTPDETGMGYYVVDSVRDALGRSLRSSRPRHESTFNPDFVATASNVWGAVTTYDGLGRPIEQWTDQTSGQGRVTTLYEAPGVVFTEDGALYQRRDTLDQYGRLIMVEEGRDMQLELMGSYTYNGHNQVAMYTDGEGTVYAYEYDGAGRLTDVLRDDAQQTNGMTHWYSYSYDGPYPTARYEVGTQNPVVTWDYDGIGRILRKDVLDLDAQQYDAYTYAYDRMWLGALDQTTDPYGTVTYDYLPEDFGSLGRPSSIVRTWSAGNFIADHHYDYDLAGNVTSQTWPGGVIVDATYGPAGHLLQNSVMTNSGREASLEYTFDEFGLSSGFVGNELGHAQFEHRIARNTPTRIDYNHMLHDGLIVGLLDYTYDNNGRLTRKTADHLFATPIHYAYDDQSRIRELRTDVVLEEFDYDLAGKPLSLQKFGHYWSYDPAHCPVGNVDVCRTDLTAQALGDTDYDSYNYDIAGRIESETRVRSGGGGGKHAYAYDGIGRVRHIEGGIGLDETYGYDDGSQMVYSWHETNGTTYRFQGSLLDNTGELLQTVLPSIRVRNSDEILWVQHDLDGQAYKVYDSNAVVEHVEVAGAYGNRLGDPANSTFWTGDWAIDGLDGGERDFDLGLVQRGVRHAALDNGLWLQPEPMLMTDPLGAGTVGPRAAGSSYAAGNPIGHSDRGGMATAVEYDQIHLTWSNFFQYVPKYRDGLQVYGGKYSRQDFYTYGRNDEGHFREFIGINPIWNAIAEQFESSMKDWAATQLAALDAAAGQGPLIPAPWATRHEPPSGQAEGFLQEAGLKSYHKTGLAYKEKVGGEPIALEIKIGAEFQHNSATTKVYSQETVSVNFGPFSMYDTVGVQGEVPAHFQDHFVDALQMQLTLMIYDDHDVVYNPAQ